MRSPPAKPRFTVSMHSKRRWGILVDEKAEPQPQRAPMSRRCFMLLIFTGSLTLFGGIGLLVAASDGDGGGQTAKHNNAMWVTMPPALGIRHRPPPPPPLPSPPSTPPPPPSSPPIPSSPPPPSPRSPPRESPVTPPSQPPLPSSPPPTTPPPSTPPPYPPFGPPPHPPCSNECQRNTLPRLPILHASNAHLYSDWADYIHAIYHSPLRDNQTMDLNTFTIFYRGHAATDALINQQIDPCFQVCTLRSWPDRPWVMDGTAWIGDDGPEQGVGTFAFFVSRPKLTREAAQSCTKLEVMHVHTDWLGGEIGVSWYAVSSSSTATHTLPPHSHNNLLPLNTHTGFSTRSAPASSWTASIGRPPAASTYTGIVRSGDGRTIMRNGSWTTTSRERWRETMPQCTSSMRPALAYSIRRATIRRRKSSYVIRMAACPS